MTLEVLQFGWQYGPYNPGWMMAMFYVITLSLIMLMHFPILISLILRIRIGGSYPSWHSTPSIVREHFKKAGRYTIVGNVSVWIVFFVPGIMDWILAVAFVTSVFIYFAFLTALTYQQYKEYHTIHWY
ncbi:MAG: hypothetical protein E3J35_02415 [Methanomassiliicoccales archaeon]|nr:MAG: hypothetical protein E3J35_02415 [Methanomassiliicoccales archaeon]